jgi:hypothetical protein
MSEQDNRLCEGHAVTRFMRTRNLLVAGLIAATLSGCGSSTPAAHMSFGDPVHYAGTMTISSTDATITASFSVGPVVYSTAGTPPTEALEACDWDNPSVIANTAFVRGELTLHYARGSASSALALLRPVLLISGQEAGKAVLDIDHHWACGQNAQHPEEILHRGEFRRYAMWLLTEPLGSSKIRSAVSDSWQFNSNALSPWKVGPNSTVTMSGPDARTCGTQTALFLYPTARSC